MQLSISKDRYITQWEMCTKHVIAFMGGKQAWTPIFYHVIFQTRTMDMKHRLCIKPSPFQYGMLFKAPRIYYFFCGDVFLMAHIYDQRQCQGAAPAKHPFTLPPGFQSSIPILTCSCSPNSSRQIGQEESGDAVLVSLLWRGKCEKWKMSENCKDLDVVCWHGRFVQQPGADSLDDL